MAKIIALIPARKGSLRVKNKNIRNLGGHPMISYSIQSAINSKMFQSIIVASDSELICEIGNYYGATKSIKRNESDSSSTSLDIEWLKNLDHISPGRMKKRYHEQRNDKILKMLDYNIP